MHGPIAYKYDADYHCPYCAEQRFGRSDDGYIAGENADGTYPEDSEGNPVWVLLPWDEWWNLEDECEALSCGTCGVIIDNAHRGECEENYGDEPCTLPKHARLP